MMKKKLAFVVQRYGLEVNGGAELLTRQMAEHIADIYDVEVITTKAIEYTTWVNEYKNDVDVVNGITVRRFGVERPRDLKEFEKYHASIIGNRNATLEQEDKWFELQGPLVPELIQYIEDNADNYDVFVFTTYLYYTTVKGLPKVREKAILIPTAHDEPTIYLKTFKSIFKMPKALFYLTVEEKKFVERTFNTQQIINNGGFGGSGIEIPEKVDPLRFKNEKSISKYMVYAGRIDESKSCHELFEYFLRYKKNNNNDIKLVMIGKEVLKVPKSDDIISLGFVSDQDKFDIIAGAEFLVLPSHFESLSIAVLEAMKLSVPVLVSGKCNVLKDHCIRSNAGLYYTSYYEFEGCINYMLEHLNVLKMLGDNGVKYVDENYTWNKIISRFSEIVEQI